MTREQAEACRKALKDYDEAVSHLSAICRLMNVLLTSSGEGDQVLSFAFSAEDTRVGLRRRYTVGLLEPDQPLFVEVIPFATIPPIAFKKELLEVVANWLATKMNAAADVVRAIQCPELSGAVQ